MDDENDIVTVDDSDDEGEPEPEEVKKAWEELMYIQKEQQRLVAWRR